MRKVYHTKSSSLGLLLAVAASATVTVILFSIIPFSHLVNKPTHTVELRKTAAVDLPPPVEDPAPPPPAEAERPPEAEPEPQLAETPQQQIPLNADLEVAAGSGGALLGFGEIRALTAAESVQQEAFDVSDLEKRPEVISQFQPAYPQELRKARIDGLVTLVFVLSEEGRVEEPRIESSSRPEFEKPALDAVRKWRFRPGLKDGQPVRTFIRYPLRFRISSG